MRYLRIKKCNDPHKWYADKIGDVFPIISISVSDGYRTRQEEGYVNFISLGDAEEFSEIDYMDMDMSDALRLSARAKEEAKAKEESWAESWAKAEAWTAEVVEAREAREAKELSEAWNEALKESGVLDESWSEARVAALAEAKAKAKAAKEYAFDFMVITVVTLVIVQLIELFK